MTYWMNLGVSGQCGWPDSQIEVNFGSQKLILMPQTNKTSASVHIVTHSDDQLDEMTTVNRFLSVVAWAYKDALHNDYGWSGNVAPCPVPKQNLARSINHHFLNIWSPLADSKQRLALALYREALSLNSLPYQFLGFFKVINILHKNGPAQKAWIKETLPKLTDSSIQERLVALAKIEPDVSGYLYESGRCAVAHAFADPLIDPDDLTHLRRLSADIGVIRALAEYFIKYELKVPDCP